ncbi:MAG: hypothetical protein OEY63_05925, partial [Gemmatimonadota bacterium]|nr:hypothetical protein [Gemmatimonadota bacterium]
REVIPKLVSLASGDTKADSSWIDNNEEFPEISCSYTGPKAGDVLALLRKTGAKKSVVLTFNSRNWNNYEDKGLLILWSEGQSAEYLSLDDFKQNDTWQVDESDWANAGAGLFGEKKPFQDTYE